jgi:hypothetical protein
MSGGGGGSGYTAPSISSATLTTASATTVANTGNAYYSSPAGVPGGISAGGNSVRFVIRYPV